MEISISRQFEKGILYAETLSQIFNTVSKLYILRISPVPQKLLRLPHSKNLKRISRINTKLQLSK